jgi:hypothetical protein
VRSVLLFEKGPASGKVVLYVTVNEITGTIDADHIADDEQEHSNKPHPKQA